MSETRKNPEKELEALAVLKDTDIDTSAIPEVKDWTNALTGRFCRLIHKQVTVLPDDEIASSLNVQLAVAPSYAVAVTAAGYTQMESRQVFIGLLTSNEAAAAEFSRRFGRLIARTVFRVATTFGHISPELIDDLVQETYCKILTLPPGTVGEFRMNRESAVLGFIKTVAANVAHDYFRKIHAQKRAIGIPQPLIQKSPTTPATSADSAYQDRMFAEIDQILKRIASDRDRDIFLLYYRQGLTAREISQTSTVNLTIKGVESILFRLTKLLRSKLTAERS